VGGTDRGIFVHQVCSSLVEQPVQALKWLMLGMDPFSGQPQAQQIIFLNRQEILG
jgi:hypothetical protein